MRRTGWLVALIGLLLGLTAVPASGASWPMFHRDQTHGGVSPETVVSTANASGLGVAWQANTGAAVQASPVVARVASLNRFLVFVGNLSGKISAFDAVTGVRRWVFSAGANVNSTAAVVGNIVYVGSSDHVLYALNAATGKKVCSFTAPGVLSSSPVVVNPDGTGKVVYIGENGFTGNDDGGHLWAINAVDPNAAPNCSAKWSFDAFGDPVGSQPLVGSWSPPAFARDANGRPLIVFGSSSPEGAVYAVDARTGQKVWRFQTRIEYDSDVGAGPTISAPGVNGFADGVAYVAGKSRILYALNLRTGAPIWSFDFAADHPDVLDPARSTAALVGRTLVVGSGAGVYALDAVTGAKLWHAGTVEVVSSPAIVGPAGARIVVFGDRDGNIQALDLATGAVLWTYATGANIYASPAVSNGRIYMTAATGFVYAFAVGGPSGGVPDTTIGAPTQGATLANTGSVAFSGTASDDVGVSQVLLAVKDRNTGRWWSPSTSSWGSTFTQFAATLGSPGAPSTSWARSMPVPASGGLYTVQAEAVDGDGQHDPIVALVDFGVASLTFPPTTTIDDPVDDQVFHAPTAGEAFTIVVRGTATDTQGGTPGIAQVWVVVKNLEHNEYYCGAVGCGSSGESSSWQPTYKKVAATVALPGATSTMWTFSFLTYDHPHRYRISAWAVDRDGNQDLVNPSIRICVRAVGDEVCY
jgi:outer membrane protein assembly factor BamB